jgi:hypothetical protein
VQRFALGLEVLKGRADENTERIHAFALSSIRPREENTGAQPAATSLAYGSTLLLRTALP